MYCHISAVKQNATKMKLEKILKLKKLICLSLLTGVLLQGCEYEIIPGPNIPRETATVEAIYIKTANPVLSNSPIWEEANFSKISLSDLITGQSYGDGYRDANGTINGISGLGGSNQVGLTLKAMYDDEYIYILAQWNDSTLNVQYKNWLWEDNKWFRVGNTDKLIIKFEMGEMKDVWQWSAALTEPIGYATDGIEEENIFKPDEGELTFEYFSNELSKPIFEWDGEAPIFTKPSGFPAILDPAYFIAGTTDYIGDPSVGRVLFKENCIACHGNYGESGFNRVGYGESLDPEKLNRWSRKTMDDFIRSETHDGNIVFSTLDYIDKANLFAYIRGAGGIPGFRLQEPSGSAADVEVQTFISLVKVNPKNTNYEVMFKRKLQTGMQDDVQFNPETVRVRFGILLSDNDDLNFVGALNQELIFLESKY